MIIQQNHWGVGSLGNTDPNARSFHHSGERRPGKKKPDQQEFTTPQGDSVTLTSQPGHHDSSEEASTRLGDVISFSQTQDAFLQKVQHALERMGELSRLAQTQGQTDTDRKTCSTEFISLQNQIRDLESKMFQAADVFHTSWRDIAAGPSEAPSPGATPAGVDLAQCIEKLDNPGVTEISDAVKASNASNSIECALGIVAELRSKVDTNLHDCHRKGEQLSLDESNPTDAARLITNTDVAEESTQMARFKMLRQSREAMLAQANAMPQSAFRLLG